MKYNYNVWKIIFGILIIGSILFGVVSYVQFKSLTSVGDSPIDKDTAVMVAHLHPLTQRKVIGMIASGSVLFLSIGGMLILSYKNKNKKQKKAELSDLEESIESIGEEDKG